MYTKIELPARVEMKENMWVVEKHEKSNIKQPYTRALFLSSLYLFRKLFADDFSIILSVPCDFTALRGALSDMGAMT